MLKIAEAIPLTINMIEFMAVYLAVKYAILHLQVDELWVEGDSMVVINWLVTWSMLQDIRSWVSTLCVVGEQRMYSERATLQLIGWLINCGRDGQAVTFVPRSVPLELDLF